MNTRNINMLFFIIALAVYVPTYPIKLTFKGGASKVIDLAIFKNEGNFQNFISAVHGSKDIARDIEEITQENSAIVGEIAGQVGQVAIALKENEADREALSFVVPLIKAGTALVVELVGHLSIATAYVIKEAAKKTVNHYKEDMKPGSSVCYGFTGQRLIRHKPFPVGKDQLMDPKNRQDMFLAIFNKQLIKDDAGHIIAYPNDVIYAGPIKAADLGAAFDVTTYILSKYEMEEDGVTRTKDDSGNDILKVSLAVGLKKTSETGGENCP